MRHIIVFVFSLFNFCTFAQIRVGDIANISIDVPYGFRYIEDWERRNFNVPNNSIAFISEEAGESSLFDLRAMLGLINDDVYECFYQADVFKNITTPLQKKHFQSSHEYQEILTDFQHEREKLYNYPVCFSVTNLERYASDYDLEKRGFYIKLPFLWTIVNHGYYEPQIFPWNLCRNGEIQFSIPEKILKKFFKVDYYQSSSLRPPKFYLNEFLAQVSNENIALAIESDTEQNRNFGVVCLTHFEKKDKKNFVILDDIILYHRPTETVIWSISKGDLSKSLNL